MTPGMAGDRIDYHVTWLEMNDRPNLNPAPKPDGEDVEVVEAVDFPEWYFFALYDAVGVGYAWDDMHELASDEANALLGHPKTSLHSMMRSGWPQGFYLLDRRNPSICDIAYFGLVEQAIGRGLGGWLLDDAIAKGWNGSGVAKLTVNTCTLDHPAALKLYVGRGFKPVRHEARSRILKSALKFPHP